VVRLASPCLGEIALPARSNMPNEGALEIGFRPHAVRLQAPDSVRADGHVWAQGTVTDFEFLGEFVRYHIDIAQCRIVADQPHRAGHAPFATGGLVDVGIAPAEMRLIRD
jgi:iron(III) transport system ATP-binding protein